MKHMNKNIGITIQLVTSLLVFLSCAAVEDKEIHVNGSENMSFTVRKDASFTKTVLPSRKVLSTPDYSLARTDAPMAETMTKALMYDSSSDLTGGVIGMLIYDCPEENSPAGSMTPHVDSPIHIQYNATMGLWVPREYQRWSETDGYLRFYSWYPFESAEPSAGNGAEPSFSYTTPQNVALHKDLLVSDVVTVEDSPSGYPVELTFRHVLAGVRFAVRHGQTMRDLTVSGIHDSGTCSLGTGLFSSLSQEGNEYTISTPSVEQNGVYDVMTYASMMLLLPQTCPSGAELSVTVDGVPYSASLEGQELTSGYVSTFILDIYDDSFTLEIDRSTLAFDYQGIPENGSSLTVTSYKTHGPDVTDTGWTAQIDDGGVWVPLGDALLQPDYSWLSSMTTSVSSPSASTTTMSLTVPARQVTSHEARLKTNRILDTAGSTYVDNSEAANAVDLSRYDFISRRMESARYTSNCYVVSSPGWYQFPLVYGNAIENDATVEKSYKGKAIQLGHLDGFKNYKHDLNIASPWIEQDWATWLLARNSVASVRVLLEQYTHYDGTLGRTVTQGRGQGSPNMGVITNVSLVTGPDGRYIRFYVNPETIRPGNAVIGALDAGGDTEDDEGETGALVMWSWHIWITDQPMDVKTVTNANGSWDVLPVNTGWTDDTEGTYYAPREARIRFVCDENPSVVSETLTVVQREHESVSVSGWGPYYQWGRKDPFIEGLFTYKANYDTGMRGSIRHPDWFNSEVSTYFSSQYYDWATNNYNNLWDSQCTDYGVPAAGLPNHRTVMDPSPRRFCVSPDYTWDGFSSYGYKGSFENGFHFYTDSSMEETIFFPAVGHISYNGVAASSSDNRYWTVHAWASLQRRASYGLRFGASTVETCYYTDNHRAIGEALRSVRFN